MNNLGTRCKSCWTH